MCQLENRRGPEKGIVCPQHIFPQFVFNTYTVKKSVDFTVKYLESGCQFFYRYFTAFTRRTVLVVVVVALLFYVHGKHLRSCRDGQLT